MQKLWGRNNSFGSTNNLSEYSCTTFFVSSLRKGILLSKFTYAVLSVLNFQMALTWAKKVTWTLLKITETVQKGSAGTYLKLIMLLQYSDFSPSCQREQKHRLQDSKAWKNITHNFIHSGVWPTHITHGKSLHPSWASLKERAYKARSSWSRSHIWPGITNWWEKPILFPEDNY